MRFSCSRVLRCQRQSDPADCALPKFPSFYAPAELTRSTPILSLGMYVGCAVLLVSLLQRQRLLAAYRLVPTWPLGQNADAVCRRSALRRWRRIGVSFGRLCVGEQRDPGRLGPRAGGSDGATASFGADHTERAAWRSHAALETTFRQPLHLARARASVPFTYSQTPSGSVPRSSDRARRGWMKSNPSGRPDVRITVTRKSTTGVVGYKSVGGPRFTSSESAAYFKLEFSFSP